MTDRKKEPSPIPREGGKDMTVVEKKPVPIYEVQCFECKSRIQYKASETSYCHITCPVCGTSLWAMTIMPVRMEGEE